MALQLTEEMRLALERTADHPVTVEDGVSHREYVLVPLSTWRRMAALFQDDVFDAVDAAAAQSAAAGAAGWDDPEMDVYDDYDAHRPRP